jgi:hypothetical protein
MKRMMHPQHGLHHPLHSGDREDMLKNGWVDEPDEEPAPPVAKTPDEAPKRKPGRPPKAKP